MRFRAYKRGSEGKERNNVELHRRWTNLLGLERNNRPSLKERNAARKELGSFL